MQKGTVKFFNKAKGFGFIVDSSTRKEVFVHISGVEKGELNKDDLVEFEVEDGKRGKSAINVRKV